jgi:hypothetical protein
MMKPILLVAILLINGSDSSNQRKENIFLKFMELCRITHMWSADNPVVCTMHIETTKCFLR